MERTDTVSELEKQKIWEVLDMLDRLWDESPRIQRIRAQSEERGRMEGRMKGLIEGRIEGIQSAIIAVIIARFPTLQAFAQDCISHITDVAVLQSLAGQIASTPDEMTARQILEQAGVKQ
jgi:hypothetical protein